MWNKLWLSYSFKIGLFSAMVLALLIAGRNASASVSPQVSGGNCQSLALKSDGTISEPAEAGCTSSCWKPIKLAK